MTANILAIVAGLVGIAGFLVKFWYDRKQREPYNRRRDVKNVYEKEKNKTTRHIVDDDWGAVSDDLDSVINDIRRMRGKNSDKVPR